MASLADRQRQGRRISELGRDAEEEFVIGVDEDDRPPVQEEEEDITVLPARKRSRGVLQTIEQLVNMVRALIKKQTDAAIEMQERAIPNEPITGDAYVRTAFQTILANQHQRQLFMETAGVPRNWPRLKPLFGAPPYHFLFTEDAGMLRATGVSRGRQNMVYENEDPFFNVTNITQFGDGQLRDQHNRYYRVMPNGRNALQPGDPLHFRVSLAANQNNIIMHVKIPKRSRDQKLRLLANQDTRRQCFFPASGEKLQLQETGRVLSLIGQPFPSTTNMVVQRMFPRDETSSTAIVVASVG